MNVNLANFSTTFHRLEIICCNNRCYRPVATHLFKRSVHVHILLLDASPTTDFPSPVTRVRIYMKNKPYLAGSTDSWAVVTLSQIIFSLFRSRLNCSAVDLKALTALKYSSVLLQVHASGQESTVID